MVAKIFKKTFCEQLQNYMIGNGARCEAEGNRTKYFKNGETKPLLILETGKNPVVMVDRKDLNLDFRVLSIMQSNEINPDHATFSEEEGYLIYKIN